MGVPQMFYTCFGIKCYTQAFMLISFKSDYGHGRQCRQKLSSVFVTNFDLIILCF